MYDIDDMEVSRICPGHYMKPPMSSTKEISGCTYAPVQAMRLIRAGYDVVVWNRTPEACDDLAAGGVQVADSPAAVTEACDITLAMLADPRACMEVACGKNGAVEGLRAGKGYIDASTVDVLTAQRVEHSVQATGAAFLEAPVSGSKGPAEQGKLIFMTAGTVCGGA